MAISTKYNVIKESHSCSPDAAGIAVVRILLDFSKHNAGTANTEFTGPELEEGLFPIQAWSNVITITVELPNLLPIAPVLSITDFTGTTVTLSWTESDDPDGYVSNYLIQMSPNPAFAFISGTWFINDTSLAIANLPAGPCFFRVSAIDNEDALGEWSNVCDILVPGIPTTITSL